MRHSLRYSGTYRTADGREHMAEDMELVGLDEGIDRHGDGFIAAALPDPHDGEENIIEIPQHLWEQAVCEQTGGHNFIDHQGGESAMQICTRCGKEVDPA
jgi:hypothetical protein